LRNSLKRAKIKKSMGLKKDDHFSNVQDCVKKTERKTRDHGFRNLLLEVNHLTNNF